jgi:hypothetical protein
MNFEKINSYIQSYKDNFELVNHQELYKWKAVKQFQDHWDIEAEDFYAMLSESLSLTFNLLDSGQYFPKRMLLRYAHDHPGLLRSYFKELYDEENDINNRIETFRSNLQILNENYEDAENDYQDHRAIIVYLALRFPDRYYFYKQRMFKAFVEKVDYDYKSIAGRIENISQFNYLCDIIKHELSQDQELIRIHNSRLTENCYVDTNLNILTQDFIYAVVAHLPNIENNEVGEVFIQEVNVETKDLASIQVTISNIGFTPSTTNHIQNNIENKRLGNLGELFVMEYEKKQLTNLNLPNLAARVSHDAATIGDGLGYDILSFDANGNEKYIEVKTTRGNTNTVFYITRTEMERSKIEKENFYLYRVYNFNDETLQGDIQIIRGDISGLCVEPVNYKVKMI